MSKLDGLLERLKELREKAAEYVGYQKEFKVMRVLLVCILKFSYLVGRSPSVAVLLEFNEICRSILPCFPKWIKLLLK